VTKNRFFSVVSLFITSGLFSLLVVVGCRSASTGNAPVTVSAKEGVHATIRLKALFTDKTSATQPSATQPAASKEKLTNPDAVLAFFQAKSSMMEKDNQEAIEHLKRAVGLDKNYLPAQSLLTKLYFDQNQLQLAQTHAKIVLSLDPNDAMANYVLGSALLKDDDFDAASRYLYKAMVLWNRPDKELTLEGMLSAFKLGGTLAGRGYITAALDVYRPLLEQMDRLEGDDTLQDSRIKRMIKLYRPGIYLLVGEFLLKLKNYPEALDYFQRGQKIQTITTQATLGTIRTLARMGKHQDAQSLLNVQSRREGIDDQVLDVYREVYPGNTWCEKVAENFKPDLQNVNMGLKIAETLQKNGNYELAGSVLQKVVHIDPSNSQALALLVRTFEKTGKTDQTANVLVEAIASSDSKSTAIPMALKRIDAKTGQELVSVLRKLSVPSGREYARLYLLGLTCQTTGQTRFAEDYFQSGIRFRSDFLPAYLSYGQLLLQQRRWNDAITVMDQALGQNLKSGGIYYIKGCALMERNEISKALTVLNQARELSPDSDQVILALTECYLRSTDPNKAFELLKKMIADNMAGPSTMSRLVQILIEADSASLAETILQQYAQRFGQDDDYKLLAAKLNFSRDFNVAKYQAELALLKSGGFESSALEREIIELEFNLGNFDKAIELGQKAISNNSLITPRDYQRILELEAFSYWRLLDYDRSEQSWKQLSQIWPNQNSLKRGLARMYIDAQMYDQAIPLVREILASEKDPEQQAQLQLWLVNSLEGAEKGNEAIAVIDDWIGKSENLDRARLYRMKIGSLVRQKRYSEAVSSLEKLIAAKEVPIAQWQQLLVTTLLENGQKQQAKKAVEGFLSKAAKADRPLFEGLKISVLLELKQYDEAIGLARTMIASSSKEQKFSSNLLLVKSFQEAGQYEACLKFLRDEMTKLPPNSTYGEVLEQQVVHTLEMARKFKDAESLVQKKIQTSSQPGKNQWQQILVAIYFTQGKQQQAIKVLEEILSVSPNLGWANNSLGYSLADTNRDLSRAEKLVRKALASDPGNASYLDSLGWVLCKQGKYDQAYRYAMMSYRGMERMDPVILEHLGDICFRMGKAKDAGRYWQLAIDASRDQDPLTLEPGFPERTVKKLKQLK